MRFLSWALEVAFLQPKGEVRANWQWFKTLEQLVVGLAGRNAGKLLHRLCKGGLLEGTSVITAQYSALLWPEFTILSAERRISTMMILIRKTRYDLNGLLETTLSRPPSSPSLCLSSTTTSFGSSCTCSGSCLYAVVATRPFRHLNLHTRILVAIFVFVVLICVCALPRQIQLLLGLSVYRGMRCVQIRWTRGNSLGLW